MFPYLLGDAPWEAIKAVPVSVAAFIAALAALSGAFWWLVKPRFVVWLRKELIEPVQAMEANSAEVHHTVTQNSHSTPGRLTMVDRLSDLQHTVTGTQDQLRDLHALLADHLVTEQRTHERMWEAIHDGQTRDRI